MSELRRSVVQEAERPEAQSPVAARLHSFGARVLPLVGAVAAALGLEAWVGDGFTWMPRSPLAWLAALAVFVLGEAFLHWFLRQVKYVAEQDVGFQAVSTPSRRSPESDAD